MSWANETMRANVFQGKLNTAKWLAESTWAASVSICLSWSPIECMSDFVLVQIFHFIYVDSLHYGHFNL